MPNGFGNLPSVGGSYLLPEVNISAQRPSGFGTGASGGAIGNWLGSSALGQGLSLAKSAVGGLLGMAFSKWQMNQEKKMMDYKYQKDLEMWTKMNEYNSPTNQMKRFAAAGLNPNLIYGKGSPGNATVLPKYQGVTPKFSPLQVGGGNMIDNYYKYKMADANVDNIKADQQYKLASAVERLANAGLSKRKKEKLMPLLEDLYRNNAELAATNATYNREAMHERIRRLQLQNDMIDTNLSFAKRTLESRVWSENAKVRQILQKIDLNDLSIKAARVGIDLSKLKKRELENLIFYYYSKGLVPNQGIWNIPTQAGALGSAGLSGLGQAVKSIF